MSVRRRTWRDPDTGAQKEAWMVDVDFTTPEGARKRIRKVSPVPTRRGAEEYERQLRASLLDGSYHRQEADAVPTLAEFGPKFIEGYAKANRQKRSSVVQKESVMAIHLVPALGHKRLDEITAQDVQRLKASMIDRKPKTLNNVLTVLSKCLKVAVEWGVIDAMPTPVKLVKVGPAPFKFYDVDEYARLVDAAGRVDPRVHAFVLLCGDAGLRDGEAIALEWSDVDFRRQQLHVQRAVCCGVVDAPKGGRGRHVPMTKALSASLQALRHLRGPRVLYRDDGTEVSWKLTRGWIISAQRLAGLEVNGHIHQLRHTFCSRLAMKGAPMKAIQELAGHANLSTTQKYMHLSPSEKDRAIRLLDAPPHGTRTAHEPQAKDGGL